MGIDAARAIALRVFRRVADEFPNLRATLEEHPTGGGLEVAMIFDAQPGLDFDVHLNLQNEDELHLVAGALWIEWFPCTLPEREEAFFDAASGVLSGRYRLVEEHRGATPVRALLQRPDAHGWTTVAGWSTWALPWPRKKCIVLHNRGAA